MSVNKIPDENDEEIVLKYQNGDEAAFKTLIDRYISPLYNFIARIAGRNDASDIVKKSCRFILQRNGGEGVVAEILDKLIDLNVINKKSINIKDLILIDAQEYRN